MKINFYGPVFIILIICLTLSIGLNIVFYTRINTLDRIVINTNSPLSNNELLDISKEIDRLSNIQYDIKTKQPINNDLIKPTMEGE